MKNENVLQKEVIDLLMKDIHYEDYKDALFEYDKQHSFRVEKHKIYSIEQQKKSPSAFYDKKLSLMMVSRPYLMGIIKLNKLKI